jgi:hypothetical protein
MTTVTIRKKKHNLEEIIASALKNAATANLGYYDQSAIENHPEMESQIRFCKALSRICGWAPRYEKLADVNMSDQDDVIDAVGALLKIWNRRAGARAIVSKYGRETASRIVGRNLR